jgi:hypothetical protein
MNFFVVDVTTSNRSTVHLLYVTVGDLLSFDFRKIVLVVGRKTLLTVLKFDNSISARVDCIR